MVNRLKVIHGMQSTEVNKKIIVSDVGSNGRILIEMFDNF